jgi:hypothetical protein
VLALLFVHVFLLTALLLAGLLLALLAALLRTSLLASLAALLALAAALALLAALLAALLSGTILVSSHEEFSALVDRGAPPPQNHSRVDWFLILMPQMLGFRLKFCCNGE